MSFVVAGVEQRGVICLGGVGQTNVYEFGIIFSTYLEAHPTQQSDSQALISRCIKS